MTKEVFCKASKIVERISILKREIEHAKCINSLSCLPRECEFNYHPHPSQHRSQQHQTNSVLVPKVLFKPFARMIESELKRELFELEKELSEL